VSVLVGLLARGALEPQPGAPPPPADAPPPPAGTPRERPAARAPHASEPADPRKDARGGGGGARGGASAAAREGPGAARDSAWAAALLFASHPVHVEAVSNVVSRAELLCAACYLAAFFAYSRAAGWGAGGARAARGTGAVAAYAAACVGAAAAVMSKETGLTLLGVLGCPPPGPAPPGPAPPGPAPPRPAPPRPAPPRPAPPRPAPPRRSSLRARGGLWNAV